MADGGLTVLDGAHLRAVDTSLPESEISFTGAQVLELAESKASASLFNFLLPQNIKTSARNRLNVDPVSLESILLDRQQASSMLNDYITAIADELKDDPLVVSVLDGNTLRLFLEDEDDFAMLAENLFTDLDTEDKGKIRKSEIRNALVHMGVDMGVPPFSEFPLLNDILKKHSAEGEGEVGQAQFAQLLQPVLQELAEALADKPIVVIQNIKIVNGSKLRKVLADEKQMNNIIEMLREKYNKQDGEKSTERVRGLLEKHAKELGLPHSEANEAVLLLYDAIFSDVQTSKNSVVLDNGGFGIYVKEILEKFAEHLEVNPVFYDLEN